MNLPLDLVFYPDQFNRLRAELLTLCYDVNKEDEVGRVPIWAAAATDNVRALDELITAGARVDKPMAWGQETACFVAATYNHVRTLRVLIDVHANLDQQNDQGVTPIAEAVRKGHLAAVRLLLAAKVNVNLADCRGQSPLHLALSHNRFCDKLVRLLIDSGANVNQRNGRGETPILHAVRNQCYGALQMLIDARADVALDNSQGLTPVHQALNCDNLDFLRVLLRAGANPNGCVERQPAPPAWYAAICGRLHHLQVLLSAGVDPNALDNVEHKRTLCCAAATRAKIRTLCFLVSSGGDWASVPLALVREKFSDDDWRRFARCIVRAKRAHVIDVALALRPFALPVQIVVAILSWRLADQFSRADATPSHATVWRICRHIAKQPFS